MNAATAKAAQTIGARLKSARALLGLSQEEMAKRVGIPIDTYKKYESNARTPGGKNLARLSAAGINISAVLAGTEPMTDEAPRAEQPAASYQALDPRTVLSAVNLGVDEFLAGRNPTPEERRALLDLAFDYMMAKATTDREVLSKFLRQVSTWARSTVPQPAPGVPVADDTPSVDLTRTYRDGEAPSAPAAKDRKGEK